MSAHHAAAAADTGRRAAQTPLSGSDAVWAQPFLNRLLGDGRPRLGGRYPWLLDTAVVLGILAISLPRLLQDDTAPTSPFGDTEPGPELSTGILWLLVAAYLVPLWWRRKAPTITFLVIAVVSVVQWSLGVWLPTGIAGLVALYTVARYGSLRVLGWVVALAAAVLLLAAFVLAPGSADHPVIGGFFLLGAATAAVAVGLALRILRMYQEALEDRARRMEIEQEQRVRLTAAAERSRVAREMHDIVGHNLSVMVSVADGAATLAANRSERSVEALRVLGDTGRQAMSELRRVLGVLREEQEDERLLGPQPRIRDLDPLISRVRTAGLPVTYRTVGDLDALGDGVQLTVYRVVQESLTNTLKHAGIGTSAEVTIVVEEGRVRIRTADTGVPPGSPPRARPGGPDDAPGHGLVGIRQRAAMYGGTVVLGPGDTGHGWTVDVVLDVPPGEQLP
ncbi:sensor histidine kinase [Jiangella alkaliphila]|uniref:histidine kinase n=1 Tax=Jiangella alkaliphila TaxID=419479 RepID=A0A1H2JBI4_9ACTN|nr:histidine kinase [Jiangella alkaliphila]SDU53511.1 Signal transduction histidine kinase [Jiangella alkaliphila]